MNDKNLARGVRVFTTHNTVFYVDGASGELRHGPVASSPANALFVRDGSSGCLMYDTGGALEPIICLSERSRPTSHPEGDNSPETPTRLEVVRAELGRIGLKAQDLFLRAHPDGRIALDAPHCQAWEQFRIAEYPERRPEASSGVSAMIHQNRPLVSFVVPCFNQQKYLPELIDSVLNQAVKEVELILVDDGSSDNSEDIVRGYDDNRLTYIRQDNSGPSAAFTRGLGLARGDYIAFLGGDDVCPPDKVETQIMQIRDSQCDLIFGLPSMIGEDSEPLPDQACAAVFSNTFSDSADLYRKLFLYTNFLCGPSALASRSFFHKYGTYKLGLIQTQDFELWVRACRLGARMAMYTTRTVRYRLRRQDNLSRSYANRAYFELGHVYRSFFNNAPLNFLKQAFPADILSDAIQRNCETELEILFLYLGHRLSLVRSVGACRITDLMDDPEMRRFMEQKGFDLKALFSLTTGL